MKDDYYIKNENYKILNIENDKYVNDYKYEKIDNYKFYSGNDYKSKYDSISDKELEILLADALRRTRSSNSTNILIPTPTPVATAPVVTPTPATVVPTPTATPTPTPPVSTVMTNAGSIPTPTPQITTAGPSRMIQKFLNDTTSATVAENFRGWVLPNGQLVSQYNEFGSTGRQDHGALVKLFFSGLQEHDSAKYDELMLIYSDYVSKNHNARDIYESFAVDALGWMQVSEFGTKRIIARQERWQDRLLAPFILDFGFDLVSSSNPNQGLCYNSSFYRLYDDIKQIITLGLEQKYSVPISR